MCGRYTITSAPEAIQALFRYAEQPNFPPRYNIAPTQPIPVVRLDNHQRHFALVRWGLIPSWVKDPKTFSLLINARADSVLTKPAFRNAMRRRRCLVPADGFYEWQATGGRAKQPFYIHASNGRPFAFAGLWEVWMGPNGEEMETATIITTDANRLLQPIHSRMPVIVPPEAFDLWLDCVNVDATTATAVLGPVPEGLLEAYPISTAVNRVANDDARLIAPLHQSEPQPQAAKANAHAASEKPSHRTRPQRRHKDSTEPSLF